MSKIIQFGIVLIGLIAALCYYNFDYIRSTIDRIYLPAIFTISSKNITITPIDIEKHIYLIKLQHVSPYVSYLKNTNSTKWQEMPIEEAFRKGWYINNRNSTTKYVTGARLSYDLLAEKSWKTYYVKLTAPVYDPKTHTLTYEAILDYWFYLPAVTDSGEPIPPPLLPNKELKHGHTSITIILYGEWVD